MRHSFAYRFLIIAVCFALAGVAIFVPLFNDKGRADWLLWVLLGVLIAGFILTVVLVEIGWRKRNKKHEDENDE